MVTHQRSFERYHSRPPTDSPSPRLGIRNPNPKLQSLLSQERVKPQTASLADTLTSGSIRTNTHYKFGRKGCVGVCRDCPNFLSTPYYLRNGLSYDFTNFKFCTHIHRIDRNKSPLKFRQSSCGRIHGKFSRQPTEFLDQELISYRYTHLLVRAQSFQIGSG